MSVTLADYWPLDFLEDAEYTKDNETSLSCIFPIQESGSEEDFVWNKPYIEEELPVGAPVGIRVVQSVVRSATQGSLSFFHVAGMGIEVKQGPTVADTMNNRYNKYNTGMTFNVEKSVSLNKLRKDLLGTYLKYFVQSIQDSRITDIECVWYSVKNINIDDEDSILRFNISFKKLIEYDFTLEELAYKCFGSSVKWFVSPDFMGMIDLHIPKKSATAEWISKLEIIVCGSENITTIYFNKLQDTQDICRVYTVGSDIALASRSMYVISGSLRSNNVQDIENNYGIEAASMALRDIIKKDPAGILTDFMTRNGMVCSFSKSSIEVKRKGILTSIGYERPREDIIRAIKLKDDEQWDIHPSIYNDIMIGTDPVLHSTEARGTQKVTASQ